MSGEKEKKEFLRKRIKDLLNEHPVSLLKEESKLIQSHLFSLPEYKESSIIMFYVSIEREVYTHDMIKRALTEKKDVVVPLVLESQDIMLTCKISDFRDLKPGPWGIPQPVKEKIQNVPLSSLDLIIVPGIAFDRRGNRLGRGKGFYDRFLKLVGPKVPKVALAFSSQIVEKVPVTENDIAVDKIVTEDGVINCKL
jgi:5-formyltetrahydrofolate cyclo-ligase